MPTGREMSDHRWNSGNGKGGNGIIIAVLVVDGIVVLFLLGGMGILWEMQREQCVMFPPH